MRRGPSFADKTGRCKAPNPLGSSRSKFEQQKDAFPLHPRAHAPQPRWNSVGRRRGVAKLREPSEKAM